MILTSNSEFYEWTKYRSDDEKYGGNLAGTITGWAGSYDLTKGYFHCFDPRVTDEETYKQQIDELLQFGFFADSTRSLIISYTTFHVPTVYYTSVNMVFETVNGFLEQN